VKARATDAVDKSVGRQIRIRRNTLGMSQTDLADELGLTFQQVQKYEKGANRISAGRLLRLAVLLEVPLTYFYEDAPGRTAVVTKAAVPAFVSELLMTSTGVALARAFSKVKRTNIRRKIVNFVDAIGDEETKQRKGMV
jgi:transcriptional regulator with XRE-family HTH domain